MSVSVSVKDPKKELPIIMNSWLNNDCMRKNVDIHILYDDQVNKYHIIHIFQSI